MRGTETLGLWQRVCHPPRDEELLWLQGKDPCTISSTKFVELAGKPSLHLESHRGILTELAIVLLLDLNLQAPVWVHTRKMRPIYVIFVDFNSS